MATAKSTTQLQLFVWTSLITGGGLNTAFALAATKEQAIELIVTSYDDVYFGDVLRMELEKDEPAISVAPVGYFIEGN